MAPLTRRNLLLSAGAPAALAAFPAAADPLTWTLIEASTALSKRAISSVELTKACLARISKLDKQLNAFITLDEEHALEQARAADQRRASGHVIGKLDGIPIALKDNIDTAGLRTTAAAKVFDQRVPKEDAEITRRLRLAGVVMLGKLNLDEMAFAGTGTTGCYGPARNPWNTDHITGGSSAGSAAAVAAGLCFGSVGSDDGGSVRIPGSHCGVVGFKTSYGRVSTRGVVPSAYSMDTIGPIARTVEDAALLLQAIAGYDPLDSITVPNWAPDYLGGMHRPLNELRLGIPREYFFEQLHPETAAAVERAINRLSDKARSVHEVKLPRLHSAENGDYDVELYHYQRTYFDQSPDLYHPWSQRLLNRVKNTDVAAYIETLKRVRDCRRDIRKTFERVDVVLLPTMREPAPLISETVAETHKRPPSNTSVFNHCGSPAITVPCGYSKGGLPIGLQIAGAPFSETAVLQVAYAYQESAGWKGRKPAVVSV